MLLLTILLSSCLPFAVRAAQPTPNAGTLEAVVVSTLIAQITQTAAAATNTPFVITATPAPTKKPTKTPTATASPKPVVIPCNKGAFVADLTVPDGTSFAPGTSFVKSWRLQNVGSCTWSPDYQVVFVSGDRLNAPTAVSMPRFIQPGQTVDISIQMQAPSSAGSFEGFWKLVDPDGNIFGVGAAGDVAFSVVINVGSTSVTFAVHHVLMSVDATSITANCPSGHKFTITANIITDGPGKVTYTWEYSDGSISDEKSLDFPGAGTQTVSTTFRATETGDYWVQVRIDNPNHLTFDPIDFSLTCK
jgi:hypothetical protein